MCRSVPIARLGDMEYTASETGTGQPITARNTAGVLFSPETMASFEGKPVTVQHPDQNKDPTIPDVTPENWRDVAVGIAQNIRPGSGDDSDKLIADLLITDAAAIELVKGGLREISCGYEADMAEPDENGISVRTRIIGNHVALVDAGRAGPEISIRDSKPEGLKMKMKDWFAQFRKVLDEMPEEMQAEPVVDEPADPMKMMEELIARVAALETMVADMAKPADAVEVEIKEEPKGEGKPMKEEPMTDKCKDSLVISLAEILAPGIENTADIKAESIRAAMKTADGKAAVVAVAGSEEINYESEQVVDAVFRGAAAVLKAQRQADLAKTRTVDSAPTAIRPAITPDEINQLNARIWAKREVKV